MNKIQIAILDDDMNYSELLYQHCKKYFELHNELYQIQKYTDVLTFLNEDYTKFDLLLLDIQMPLYNGIEIAKKVRDVNKKGFICFVTDYSDYIYQSFKVHAFDYINKPVTEDKLFQLLNDVCNYSKMITNQTKIILQSIEGEIVLSSDQVLYFEYFDKLLNSFHRVIKVYTVNQEYIVKEKISNLYDRLPDGFIMPHKSFIVNMEHIKLFKQNEIIMDNNVSIPMSQKRAAEARKVFSTFTQRYY